jgi:alanine dehydrogenase
MRIGLVTEIKPGERRCALTPGGAQEMRAAWVPTTPPPSTAARA